MSYQPPTDYNPNPEWQGQGGYAQPGYSQPYGNDQQYAPPPPPQPAYGYAPPSPYPGYGAPMAPPEKGSGLAIAGLVLGIVSLVLSFFWFCSPPISIVGIVLSALGRRSISRRTMATVGLVLSIIALGLSLLFAILAIASYSTRYSY
jgi:hypothetical protein